MDEYFTPPPERFLEVPRSAESRRCIFFLFVAVLLFSPYILSYRPVESIPPPSKIEPRARSDKEIVWGDTSKNQVIFTFDGGDGNQSAEGILAALARHHVKGTFFLTGKFVERNPDLVRRFVAAGHEIFSHTYDHPHLTQLSDADVIDEFTKMASVLASTTGASPRPYFRAPYGDRDQRVLDDAFKAGYRSVYWTIDAHDWEQSTGVTAQEVHAQIMNNLAPGTIYLMHFGDTITAQILDQVFTEIENKGYRIVSLTQGL